MKANTTPNHNTVCRTSIEMYYAKVGWPLSIVSVTMLKYDHCGTTGRRLICLKMLYQVMDVHLYYSMNHCKRSWLWCKVKGKRSNKPLSNHSFYFDTVDVSVQVIIIFLMYSMWCCWIFDSVLHQCYSHCISVHICNVPTMSSNHSVCTSCSHWLHIYITVALVCM